MRALYVKCVPLVLSVISTDHLRTTRGEVKTFATRQALHFLVTVGVYLLNAHVVKVAQVCT
jgi:hypothetical protein